MPRDLIRECGHLVVLESRALSNGRAYRLAVVIYKAREPDGSPPLLLLHGGPGGAGGTRFPWRELTFPLARKRDIITFDNRGVSASEPPLCRSFVADATPSGPLCSPGGASAKAMSRSGRRNTFTVSQPQLSKSVYSRSAAAVVGRAAV